MIITKTLLTAVAAGLFATAANAAPFEHRVPAPVVRHEIRQDVRQDFRRDYRDFRRDDQMVRHERVLETLRFHHYRVMGRPIFVHGHYVVKTFNRFGRPVFVEIDPYTGAFRGEFRI